MRRRQFVETLTAGAALASTAAFAGNALAAPAASAAGSVTGGVTPSTGGLLSDQKRQQLVELAQFGPKPSVSGRNGVAVSTHPLVSQAALDVLAEGGNAVDAICAASLTQTVVEPHMTTLTGVFSMQYYDAKTGKVRYLNASNNAPKNFPLNASNMAEAGSMLGDGRGVTIPGFWAGIEAAMKEYGTISLKRALAPARNYARNGFEVHPFLWGEIFVSMHKIASHAQGREIYLPDNVIVRPGAKLYQKRAADLLERLEAEGSKYFYHGGFAEKFSKAVQDAGGWITPDDFAAYEVMWQDPVASSYRGYDVLAAPDPDFGGVVISEVMNMVELLDVKKMGPAWESGETAFKLMQILGEVSFDNLKNAFGGTTPSMATRVSKDYAAERFARIGDGRPRGMSDVMKELGASLSVPPPGSNHLTVVDKQGNVATVLHSCMSMPWSNGLFVDGISICAAGAHYFSGIPKPGNRINARIGPHMFLKNGKCVLAGGSPSVSLQENIAQNAINILDFGMPIGEAVHKPRFGGSSMDKAGAMIVEMDMPAKVFDLMAKAGGSTDSVNPWNWMNGSYDSIHIDPATGIASACGDPRRTAQAFAL